MSLNDGMNDLTKVIRELGQRSKRSDILENHIHDIERQRCKRRQKYQNFSSVRIRPKFIAPHYSEVLYDKAPFEPVEGCHNLNHLDFSTFFFTQDEFRNAEKEYREKALDSSIDIQLFGRRATSNRAKQLESNEFALKLSQLPFVDIQPAKQLLSTPINEFGEFDQLPKDVADNFLPITSESKPTLPRWGLASPDDVMKNSNSASQRLSVLLAIARSLSTASISKWRYLRFSASDIYVHKKLLDCKNGFVTDFEYVKVCNFFTSDSKKIDTIDGYATDIKRYGHSNQPSLSLFISFNEKTISTLPGETVDMYMASFTSFLLWIYSGTTLEQYLNLQWDQQLSVMERVPWFLQWIVSDCDRISIHGVFQFLLTSWNNSFEKCDVRKPFIISGPTIIDNTGMVLIQESLGRSHSSNILIGFCLVRSILVAMENNVGEAWYRMAELCKLNFDKLIEADDNAVVHKSNAMVEFKRIKDCYETAGLLGISTAFRQLAEYHLHLHNTRSKVKLYFKGIYDIDEHSTLRYIREAAILGDIRSLTALDTFTKAENQDLNIITDKYRVNINVPDDKLYDILVLDVIVIIGKQYRRTVKCTDRMHPDAQSNLQYELAYEWLRRASELGSSNADLELALLNRETARSQFDVEESIALLRKVSTNLPNQAAYEALYWLGYFYHTGVKLSVPSNYINDINQSYGTETVEVIKKDRIKAAKYLKIAACRVSGARALSTEYSTKDWQERKSELVEAKRNCNSIAILKLAEEHCIKLDEISKKIVDDKIKMQARTSISSKSSNHSRLESLPTFDDTTDDLEKRADSKLKTVIDHLEKPYLSLTEKPEPMIKSGYDDISYVEYENALNPLLLLKAAREIFYFRKLWAWCSEDVKSGNIPKETFEKSLFDRAHNLINMAIGIVDGDNRQWRKFRTNYLEIDRKIVEKAKTFRDVELSKFELK